MSTKLSIAKNISKELGITLKESKKILESVLTIIKNNSKLNDIKFSGFGTFYIHKTKERIGRNPKTKESYIIESFRKLNFKASNKVKETLN